MKRIVTLVVVCLFLSQCWQLLSAEDHKQPNILWLSAEDISPHLGCYEDPHAITPNLDQLAVEGTRFTHAFTTAGVCAPCRSGIITGMYQTTIGTHHMRCNAKLPEFMKPFPVYLRKAGYYCTNNSKTDYQFSHDKETWDQSNGKAHWRNRTDKSQPFFSVFNFTGCHESGIANPAKYRKVTKDLQPAERQDASQLTTLPPYYPDTPATREDWKRNYELITAMDYWAADLIQQLKDDGLYEQTIIFFWSDHGVGLPRAKRWLYDSGTRIPLIVRIPKQFRIADQALAGSVSEQLVSSIDLGATVLNLASVPVPEYMQGQAFLGADLPAPRKYVFGARDRMDERYDIIRSVRDNQFRYIRNYEPLKPYYQYMNTPESGATMQELRKLFAENKLAAPALLFMAAEKPAEEFYDLEHDPHEIHNLIDDPNYLKHIVRMRKVHLDWVQTTRDLGLIPEPIINQREEKLGSRYSILRQKLDDEEITQIGHIANLASQGVSAKAELLEAVESPDELIRYWAATGLGNIGKAAQEAVPLLKKALRDDSATVRVAAARAVARLGEPSLALPVLVSELRSDQQWVRLQSAIALDEMDDDARPAIEALREALEHQPNKYITRVANRAVNQLENTKRIVK